MPTDRLSGFNMGVAIKMACAVTTTGSTAVTLSGVQTIDGVSVGNAQERVLVRNTSADGIYVADSSSWIRARDCDGNKDILPGSLVYVDRGTAYAKTLWVFNSSSTATSVVVGTNDITLTQMNNAVSGVSSWVQSSWFPLVSASAARTLLSVPSSTSLTAALQLRSVKDFGAVGNGVANDTTAITAAIADIPTTGGHLWFPEGRYRVTEAITINKPGVYYGDGAGTIIQCVSSTAHVFNVTGGSCVIEKMQFSATGIIKTAGAFVNVASNYVTVRDFLMQSYYIGIQNSSAISIMNINSGYLYEGQSSGFGIVLNGGFDVAVWDIVANNSTEPASGIRIHSMGDIVIHDVNIINFNYGLDIVVDSTAEEVDSLYVSQSFFDNCSVAGARLYANSTNTGAAIQRCMFNNTWFASGSYGVFIQTLNSGVINGIDFSNCHVFLSTASGMYMTGGGISNIHFIGGQVAGNTGSGIAALSSMNGITIANASIGSVSGLAANTDYGIFLSSGCENLKIVDNTLVGNGLGGIGLPSTAGSSDWTIRGNSGIVTRNGGQFSVAGGVSSTRVPHGLVAAPPVYNVGITPAGGWSSSALWYVSSANTIGFLLEFTNANAGTINFNWNASVFKG